MLSLNLQTGDLGSRRRRLKSYHNDVMVVISVRGGSRSHSFRMFNQFSSFVHSCSQETSASPSRRPSSLASSTTSSTAGTARLRIQSKSVSSVNSMRITRVVIVIGTLLLVG